MYVVLHVSTWVRQNPLHTFMCWIHVLVGFLMLYEVVQAMSNQFLIVRLLKGVPHSKLRPRSNSSWQKPCQNPWTCLPMTNTMFLRPASCLQVSTDKKRIALLFIQAPLSKFVHSIFPIILAMTPTIMNNIKTLMTTGTRSPGAIISRFTLLVFDAFASEKRKTTCSSHPSISLAASTSLQTSKKQSSAYLPQDRKQFNGLTRLFRSTLCCTRNNRFGPNT